MMRVRTRWFAAAVAIAWACFSWGSARGSEAILIQVYQACSSGAGSDGLVFVRIPYLAYTGRDDLYRLVGRTCDSNHVMTPWGMQNENVLHEAGIRVRSIDPWDWRNADRTDSLFVEIDARSLKHVYADLYTTERLVKMVVQCVMYNAAATTPTPRIVRLTVLGPPEVRRQEKAYRVADYRYGPAR
jgi:hypothetical protein